MGERSPRSRLIAIAVLVAAATTVVSVWVGTAPSRNRIAWARAVDPTYAGVARRVGRAECGPAALAMILGHHGVETTVEELALDTGTGPSGTSLLALKQAAERRGMRGEGWRLSFAGLRNLELPVIAHVHGDHFVVVRRLAEEVVVDDPSLGRLRMTDRVFRSAWDGVVLTVAIEPRPAVEEEIG